MTVIETFFAVDVDDMERAIAFYVAAVDATVTYSSPVWSSLSIAGVRVGLFQNPQHAAGRIGLHFAVSDLVVALARAVRAGGTIVSPATEVAPGVVIAEVCDTERNTLTLRG